MSEWPIEIWKEDGMCYVRGDIADAMLHELERIRWIVGDEDAEIIDEVIAKAKGEIHADDC